MKSCLACKHSSAESGDLICRRIYEGKWLNDLCRFQRRKITFWQWLNGQRAPKAGYCGPRAKFYESS